MRCRTTKSPDWKTYLTIHIHINISYYKNELESNILRWRIFNSRAQTQSGHRWWIILWRSMMRRQRSGQNTGLKCRHRSTIGWRSTSILGIGAWGWEWISVEGGQGVAGKEQAKRAVDQWIRRPYRCGILIEGHNKKRLTALASMAKKDPLHKVMEMSEKYFMMTSDKLRVV